MSAIDASLSRLQTDHVDLYYLHGWDPGVQLEETLSTLDGLVRAGKVLHVASIELARLAAHAAWGLAGIHGWEPLVCVQNEYNLLFADDRSGGAACLSATGLALVPWSPLGGGWLTGKYRREVSAPVAGTRVADWLEPWQPDSWEQRGNERTWVVIDALLAIAEARESRPQKLRSTGCARSLDLVAPIVGARTVEQWRAIFASVAWELDQAEVDHSRPGERRPSYIALRFVDGMERTQGRHATDRISVGLLHRRPLP